MNNDKMKNLILIILITIIVGFLYYKFYLKDEINRITEKRISNFELHNKVQNLLLQKDLVDDKIIIAQKTSTETDKKIPDNYDKKEITEYFYYLIKDMNLEANMISFSEPASKTGNYRTVTINLKVDGDEIDVKNFIKTIEQSERKYVISQCSVTQASSGVWTSNLSIEVYSYN